MADFKKMEDQRYLNTLFASIARQKEIPVAVLYNNRQVVARLKSDAINKQKINIFPTEVLPVFREELVKISFFYKEIFFIFEAEVIETAESWFRVKQPAAVLASYRRLAERYKPKNQQEASLGLYGHNFQLNLVDVSTKGLAFRALEKLFEEGQTLRNITLKFANSLTVRLDGVIKHITQDENGDFLYGIEIISIERHDFRNLFTHIFENTYPYFRMMETFSGEQIFKLYEQARFLNLKPRGDEDNAFAEIVENLELVKDKPLIASNLVYQKNGKLIALGSVLRIYNRSFLGKPLAMIPQVRLNPRNKTNIYIGLADYLLNHPYFDYYLSYIDTDYEWHQDILTSATQIIGDRNKFSFEDVACYEYNLALAGEDFASGSSKPVAKDYFCETMDKPDPNFFDFCRDKMTSLEREAFGYTEEAFKLDELSQIYQAYGFFLIRKLWRILKVRDVVAYAVVECFSDPLSRHSHLDSCKIYPVNQQVDIEEVVKVIQSELELFYRLYEKKSFQLIIRNESSTDESICAPINISGFQIKDRMGMMMANREGLAEYKQLLTANFEYYSKYFPLSHPQMGIWYLEQMYPGTSIANIAGTVRLKEAVDYRLLEKAINMFVAQNDSMRLKIVEENGVPRQYVSNHKYFKLDFFDYSLQMITEFYKWENELTSIPLKMINSELFYFAIFKISDGEGGFYVNVHHSISDAWTMGLLVNQIVEIYDELKKGTESVEEKKPSYLDYILKEEEYRYSERFEEDRKFWNEKFTSLPEYMFLKPRKFNLVNPKTARRTYTIERDLAQSIRDFCNETKSSSFTVFFSILAIYLNRVTLMEDIVIGTPILNRSNAKEKETTGMFISTVPFRLLVDIELDFTSFIQLVTKEWMLLLKHQKYPYELIVKEFRERHKVTENLYDVTLSYQNAKLDINCYTEYASRWHFNSFQHESLNIHISDRAEEGVYIFNLDYLVEYFTADEIDCIYDHFTNLLKDAVGNSIKKVNELEILSSEEKQILLYEFNKTKADYPINKTIHQLFEEQVERTPENIAVVYKDTNLTYKELNDKANQLANYLVFEKEIQPNTLIGIVIENSLEQIIAIFGVLKAGGAYVPIDPDIPYERIKTIINEASIETVISKKSYSWFLTSLQKECINFNTYLCMDSIIEIDMFNTENLDFIHPKFQHGIDDLQKFESDSLKTKVTSANLAYVIFTSGSTGKPKGVLIKHHSLVNMVCWYINYFSITETDRATRYSNFSFDASVYELFPFLTIGATIYVLEETIKLDCRKMNEYFNENNITNAFLPPQIYEQFMDYDNYSLKNLTAAGDKLRHFRETNYNLFNAYGPTENTVITTCFHVNNKTTNFPIGKPISNTCVYIVNNNSNLQPIGFPGELCISGDSLAVGYLNNPQHTADKFVYNPFIPGQKMYHTGDLARWLPDGNIEFLGRIDNQVKIRGYRVELQEIESVLLKYQGVNDAIVLYKEREDSTQYLCAYIVENGNIELSELKENLSKELPAYMIPAFFILLEKLPLTPSGKIDKKALPEPSNIKEEIELVLPRNNTEEILQKIWQEILGIDKVGINNDFFEIGGDSLSLMRIHTMFYSKGWKFSFQDFYKYRTIVEIASIIDGTVSKDDGFEIAVNDNAITPETQSIQLNFEKRTGQNILLTGVTGFLGIHILDELLTKTKADIFCLIRDGNQEQAEQRLGKLLDYYLFSEHQRQIGKRIFIVNGDITLNQFGLSADEYHQLGTKIDLIIHAAALVKHYGDYQNFKRINVDGTKRMINFALRYRKKLNHISTMSVVVNSESNTSGELHFTENNFNIGQQHHNHVYIHSKCEAEKEIFKAMENGLNATIFRVGNLTARYKDGIFQINSKENMFHNIIKSIMEIGFIPEYLLEMDLEFTPVDLCSQAIVALILAGEVSSPVFHVFNHNYIKSKEYLKILGDLGIGIKSVKCSLGEYINTVIAQNNKPDTLNFLIDHLEQESELGDRFRNIISSEITNKYLKSLSFQWPKVDTEYINKALKLSRIIA